MRGRRDEKWVGGERGEGKTRNGGGRNEGNIILRTIVIHSGIHIRLGRTVSLVMELRGRLTLMSYLQLLLIFKYTLIILVYLTMFIRDQ